MTADLRVLVRVPTTAEGALHTRMTVMRCAFGRPGSSTSLFRSTGSLVSTTTGRSRSSAVAATTASTEQRLPGQASRAQELAGVAAERRAHRHDSDPG